MKNLTTFVFSFENLIKGNFLYVDKTEYVWQLIRVSNEGYFLSRPRRFGKSLLISTLKAVFQGKKELFKGLALYDKPYEWETYPVIHLSFGDYCVVSDPAKELPGYLMSKMRTLAAEHAVKLTQTSPGLCFAELIDTLAMTKPVVILVDEYDKPILNNIADPNVGEILQCLKGFYSVLKDRNDKERLLFITGVSKFSHVSLFSELNNLTDITLDADYAGMLGFTAEEVKTCFADRLPDAARAHGVPEDALMRELLDWYDGYRFSKADIHLCNPVSLTMFFKKHFEFSNYWDSTGTPSFLLHLMRQRAYDHEAALRGWYNESIFAAYELDKLDITGLLWQTGYLTIQEVRQGVMGTQYRLDFPDREVKETFMNRLLEFYAEIDRGRTTPLIESLLLAVRDDDLDGFLTLFQSVLANIDYKLHIRDEKYYQTIFFIVFRLLGIWIEAESCTNQGRIDAYVRTAKTVYVFEFKLDRSADEALAQIVDRRYVEKFQGGGLPIRLVGVNFDSTKGRIDGWEELA